MERKRCERPTVVKLDATAIGEVDRRAGKSVQRLVGARQQPVTIHTKVRVKSRSIFEVKELVLSASLDLYDLLLPQSSRCSGGKLSRERRMVRAYSRDGLTLDSGAKPLHRCFHFG